MKASNLLASLRAIYDEPTAAAKVKAAVEAGKAEDDMGMAKGAASTVKAQLLAAGMTDEDAQAEVAEAIAKGIVTDDLGLDVADRIAKAVADAKSDLARAEMDGDAAFEGDDVDPIAVDFRSDAAAIAKGADAMVNGALEAADRIAKAARDQGAAIIKSNGVVIDLIGQLAATVATLNGEIKLLKGGVGAVEKQLALPVAPRSLHVVESPYAAKASVDVAGTITKAQDALTTGLFKGSVAGDVARAINNGDVDALAGYLKTIAA